MRNYKLKELEEGLIAIVGSENLIIDDVRSKRYRTGIRIGSGKAFAVVKPKSLMQLWKVTKLCIKMNKIIIPQAANTSLTGGSTPDGNKYDRDVVIINTLNIDNILLINEGEEIVAFPGASLYKLEDKLSKINREPHSIIGSSCIGASIVGGVCNNSGGNLINRGPAYTELSLFAKVDANNELKLINHLGIELGESPEDILYNLENKNFDKENIVISSKKNCDTEYKEKVRDYSANTPARFNSDKNRLYEASGCSGKIIVFAVRLKTFPKNNNKKVFYLGTNNPSVLTDIRKYILKNFDKLPEMTEYMHKTSFDGADKYGKDIFLVIKYLGRDFMPKLFKLKNFIDYLLNSINLMVENILDKLLFYISNILPDHLPNFLRLYRDKYNHYLIIVTNDYTTKNTIDMLNEFKQNYESLDFHECNKKEGEDLLLHRFVSGIAPKKYQIINKSESGELLPLDIALPRNYDNWHSFINEEILSNSIQSFQMSHFMCMVFHWDFILKKGTDVKKVKSEILRKLNNIGAKYPAEHNVGHFYKAEKDQSEFFIQLDPTNTFNSGVGKLSKNKYYK